LSGAENNGGTTGRDSPGRFTAGDRVAPRCGGGVCMVALPVWRPSAHRGAKSASTDRAHGLADHPRNACAERHWRVARTGAGISSRDPARPRSGCRGRPR
jgi:hypothetical protein